jgi:3-oxoacyl-[acyl-carrier-protein] synthase-3
MSLSSVGGFRIAGVSTCVPSRRVDNLEYGADFGADSVRKVVSMAGVRYRHVVEKGTTSTDLCFEAAASLINRLGWERNSITGLIMVTQSPDYFLPSSSCMVHKWLGLSQQCAAFDVGLGCSGYPYALYLAATMLAAGGQQRILVLHGETPSYFPDPADHATTLLFGDAGSATAIEAKSGAPISQFCLRTDGAGYDGLIIRGGGFRDRTPADPRDLYLRMDGAAIFNFTIKAVPPLIRDLLEFSTMSLSDIDWYLFHQSNRFIMNHLAKKCSIPPAKLPIILEQFGNCGGVSLPLVVTQGLPAQREATVQVMLVGYGVGLSWGAAITPIEPSAILMHSAYTGAAQRA